MLVVYTLSGAFNGRDFLRRQRFKRSNYIIDADYVSKHLDALVADEDLAVLSYNRVQSFSSLFDGAESPIFIGAYYD